MKHSRSDGAGYLEIDHRDSPGLTEADLAQMPPGSIAVRGGKHLERDVMMCGHCQRMVVLNPGRVRARAVCLKGDHFICDGCSEIYAKTGECVPFKQVLDRAQEIAVKYAGQQDHPDATIDVAELSKPSEPRIVVTDA